jgi:competence protein ComEA
MKYKKIGTYLMIPVLAVTLTACTKDKVYLNQANEVQMTETTTPDDAKEPAFCCVYVCGAVRNPGIYELPVGSRVGDAIEKAGGFAENAAATYNLAEKVKDEQMIQVLTTEESSQIQVRKGESADGKINLNNASVEQLMTLPGIGKSKADSMIAYRTEHGGFQSIEDVKNITGIKEGVFVKIKDSITVN